MLYRVAALLSVSTCALSAPALGAPTTWSQALETIRLRDYPPGVTRYGFTAVRFPRDADGTSAVHWSREAAAGTTRVWRDANNNGQVDPGESEDRAYTVWYVAGVPEFGYHLEELTGAAPFSAPARVAELRRVLPGARPVAVGRGGVAQGPHCWAVSDRLEVHTRLELILSLVTGGTVYATEANPKWSRFWLAPDALNATLDQARAGLVGVNTRLAAAVLAAWDDWLGQRVADGPGPQGLYPLDTTPWLPTRAELPPDYLWTCVDRELRLRKVFWPVMHFTLELVAARVDLSGPRDAAITRAREEYERRVKDRRAQPYALSGADESSMVADNSSGCVFFRRANVVASVRYGGPDKDAAPPALARALAERVLWKMVNGAAVGPVISTGAATASQALFVRVSNNLEYNMCWSEDKPLVRLRVEANDADGKRPVGAEFAVAVADSALGSVEKPTVTLDADGRAEVLYRATGVGRQTITFTSPRGTGQAILLQGGPKLRLERNVALPDGSRQVGLAVECVHPKGSLVSGVRVALGVTAGPGKLNATEVVSGADGLARFVYTAPAAAAGASVTFSASATMGNPPRPVRSGPLTVVLP